MPIQYKFPPKFLEDTEKWDAWQTPRMPTNYQSYLKAYNDRNADAVVSHFHDGGYYFDAEFGLIYPLSRFHEYFAGPRVVFKQRFCRPALVAKDTLGRPCTVGLFVMEHEFVNKGGKLNRGHCMNMMLGYDLWDHQGPENGLLVHDKWFQDTADWDLQKLACGEPALGEYKGMPEDFPELHNVFVAQLYPVVRKYFEAWSAGTGPAAAGAFTSDGFIWDNDVGYVPKSGVSDLIQKIRTLIPDYGLQIVDAPILGKDTIGRPACLVPLVIFGTLPSVWPDPPEFRINVGAFIILSDDWEEILEAWHVYSRQPFVQNYCKEGVFKPKHDARVCGFWTYDCFL
mmetsp:Transcript_54148/g.90218  ORF Transcript_54148/g.90218 Transcript_54148/m.90218 type:complete len:341 (-) Transcript_54148:13-1035(-)